MAVQFHEILDAVEWWILCWVGFTRNTGLGEMGTKLVLWAELFAEIGNGKVIGPNFAVSSLNGLILCR